MIEGAVVMAGDDFEGRSCSLAEELPWDDVGVVFKGRDENFVVGGEGSGEDVGDEVDAGRGTRGEDDFLGVTGVEVFGDGVSSVFVGFGSDSCEVVGTSMDVGVDFFVVISRGVENGVRFLSGCGVVQIHQGFCVLGRVEDGEIRGDGARNGHGRVKGAWMDAKGWTRGGLGVFDGVNQGFGEGNNRLSRVFKVEFNLFDNRGSDDDAVGCAGDKGGLLWGADAKTDADGGVGVGFDGLNHFCDVGGRATMGACDPRA